MPFRKNSDTPSDMPLEEAVEDIYSDVEDSLNRVTHFSVKRLSRLTVACDKLLGLKHRVFRKGGEKAELITREVDQSLNDIRSAQEADDIQVVARFLTQARKGLGRILGMRESKIDTKKVDDKVVGVLLEDLREFYRHHEHKGSHPNTGSEIGDSTELSVFRFSDVEELFDSNLRKLLGLIAHRAGETATIDDVFNCFKVGQIEEWQGELHSLFIGGMKAYFCWDKKAPQSLENLLTHFHEQLKTEEPHYNEPVNFDFFIDHAAFNGRGEKVYGEFFTRVYYWIVTRYIKPGKDDVLPKAHQLEVLKKTNDIIRNHHLMQIYEYRHFIDLKKQVRQALRDYLIARGLLEDAEWDTYSKVS